MIFGSLFSGIGGIDLGLERAGMRCAWQVEIDEYCQKVLTKHWPDVARFRDVRDCGAHNLTAVDLIAGGFPCQDISYAGRGAGLSGARSGLWFEFARIIRELGPRYVLVENVPALFTRGFGAILGTLAALGYDAEWHCIPAAAVGAPHIRDRVFILAYTARNAGQLQPSEWKNIRDESAINGSPGDSANMADTDSYHELRRGGNVQMGRLRFSRETTPDGDNGRTQWSTEPAVGRVAYGVPNRMERLRGLGNAVVPQVAEWIGRRILEHSA